MLITDRLASTASRPVLCFTDAMISPVAVLAVLTVDISVEVSSAIGEEMAVVSSTWLPSSLSSFNDCACGFSITFSSSRTTSSSSSSSFSTTSGSASARPVLSGVVCSGASLDDS